MITVANFGSEKAKLYRLTNEQGMVLTVSNFGARIVDISLPIAGEGMRSVSLSADSDQAYLDKDFYVGSSVVPIAGRISGAETFIKGQVYHFTENEPGRTLHSGTDTANMDYWQTQVDEEENQVVFSYLLSDGKNGFPGNVQVQAIFQLTEENEVFVRYLAQSDKDTIFNPTCHVYFNLSGDFSQDVSQHRFTIDAESYVPLADNLPTGEIANVVGTPFDFRQGSYLAQGLAGQCPQTDAAGGYDHPWLLHEGSAEQVEVLSPDERVRLTLKTNQPAVIIYTYNHGPTDMCRKHGVFSLECQGLPDACNMVGFGSILLEKDQEFLSETRYRFEWK
ncbi:galactose mutarotase [Streptococcus gallolyticus]|uniref:aldose epimerase family protein n=1 Tax=Streptococcus hepaticus TaxID=3349163 RepID=UPI001C97F98D|nr:galactose mutarotase [Streptococcus gallolyticus]MBY5042046.1 galactose mutarotase [Streptococcus gallolyticus]